MTAEVEVEDSSSIIAVIKRNISALVQVEVEPVGQWFHEYEASRSRWHLVGDSELNHQSESSGEEEDDVPDVDIEDDIKYLRSLDPADWKNQDHYSVLGLKKYRYRATDDDIKKAYRVMVLRHHPDKRKGAGEEIREDDDYFTCITKAYEVLGVPNKRMSYDSVDSEFDDEIPSVNNKSKANFFEVYGPVFDRNSRWSTTRKHTPQLGKTSDSRTKVERFYNFWYDFDSWREFSYLDEEEKEKGQDREERRWIEKQNKAERARRRKEEVARIRKLVDNAYQIDPRIAKFKEIDREKKIAVKKARQDVLRKREEEEERQRKAVEDAERLKKEAEGAELKAKQEIEKKERDCIKKAFKKERKILRTFCREHNYYTDDESDRVQIMTDIEYICEALELTKIQELNKNLLSAAKDRAKGQEIILEQISEVRDHASKEREMTSLISNKTSVIQNGNTSNDWKHDDIQLLIKAVNLFPAGTSKRWETVAEYLNQHSNLCKERVAKEVLHKAKDLQSSDNQMREAANKNAYQGFEKNVAAPSFIDDSTASQRFETPQEMLGINLTPWGTDEQRLLEQALKTYPASTQERWERISECVPNRSKKECMKRYKELVEMVKAKKAAVAAANAKK